MHNEDQRISINEKLCVCGCMGQVTYNPSRKAVSGKLMMRPPECIIIMHEE
jgi:hypothetical protein